MRVLGIDPGLTRCGYAVVEGVPGRSPVAVEFAVVRTTPDAELGERLLVIADAVARVIAAHRPDVVAVERVFSQHNVRTVMGTGQSAGVAILAATRAGVQVALHTPSEVKAAVTGSGTADKDQVASMVTRLLGLAQRPTPADVTDALALGICHIWRGPGLARRAAVLGAGSSGRRAGVPAPAEWGILR